MPRKRTGTVTETLEELDALLERHRGTPAHARLRALRLIKTDPELQWPEIAERIGCSAQTLKRWWAEYREQGMQFLGGSNSGRPGQTSRANVDKKPRDVRSIFCDTCEVDESGLNREIGFERWLELLNGLPDTSDMREWADAMRAVLHTIFTDIDRISLSINLTFDLRNPEVYEPDIFITHHVSRSAPKRIGLDERKFRDDIDEKLEGFKRNSFPLHRYHPPYYLVIRYTGTGYLGVLWLWRDIGSPKISLGTLKTMLKLEPFLTVAMTNHIIRHQYFNAAASQIPGRLEFLTDAVGLTKSERSVTLHCLFGYSYDQIADLLCISLDTVRHHMKSIFKKTGTHSDAELFAKYFAAAPPADPPRR